MVSKLYHEPQRSSGFSNLRRVQAAARQSNPEKSPIELKDWFEKHNAYTLQRPVRKTFPRNPYNTDNLIGVWECSLVDVQAPSKYNHRMMYLLSVIDVFSKYLHVVPLKSKTGPAVIPSFNPLLMTQNTLNPYIGGRSGFRRIGAKIFFKRLSRTF